MFISIIRINWYIRLGCIRKKTSNKANCKTFLNLCIFNHFLRNFQDYSYASSYHYQTLARWLECSPKAQETWVQSHVDSYRRLKKWYLMLPCLTLSIIRYGSRVKWNNPGKGVAPSPSPRCSSYWKGSLQVTLDYSRQLYLYIYSWLIIIACGKTLFRNNYTKKSKYKCTMKVILGFIGIKWTSNLKLYFSAFCMTDFLKLLIPSMKKVSHLIMIRLGTTT